MKNLIHIIKSYKGIIENHIKVIRSILVRSFQIKKIKEDNIKSNVNCPICSYNNTLIWSYTWQKKKIQKYFCPHCEHIFSNWLKNDLEKTKKLFDYSKREIHNYKSIVEEKILENNIKKYHLKKGNFLDFGIGANFFIVKKMRKKYPQHEIWGCDLNEREEINYFTTYQNKNVLNKFDGTSSHAVIEHFGDPLPSWIYLNSLLKDNNSYSQMIHSFPSQIHFDLNEWSIKVPEHLCLFSKKSLKIICEKTGFKLNKIQIREHHHPIFTFTKIRNIDKN